MRPSEVYHQNVSWKNGPNIEQHFEEMAIMVSYYVMCVSGERKNKETNRQIDEENQIKRCKKI